MRVHIKLFRVATSPKGMASRSGFPHVVSKSVRLVNNSRQLLLLLMAEHGRGHESHLDELFLQIRTRVFV